MLWNRNKEAWFGKEHPDFPCFFSGLHPCEVVVMWVHSMGCSHRGALTPWSHTLVPGPGGCWGAAALHSGLWDHPQVKGWAGVLMPPLSKAGFWQWVLSVGCIWHPTGLCRWMLFPPGTLPEGQSWTAPWAGSQEQRGGFGSGGYPLLQHSPPTLCCFAGCLRKPVLTGR